METDLQNLQQRCQELERQLAAKTALDELKNTFVATSSHQLRTPLSVLKWIFSIFETDPTIAALPAQTKMLKQASASLERIIDTVNDFVNVSRIQEGALPCSPRPSDPVEIIAKAVEAHRSVAESRGANLRFEHGNLPALCSFDPILLTEALDNLLNNALDYGGEHNTILVWANTPPGFLSIGVRSEGIGIPQADQPLIGQPFFRSQSAINAHPDGSGLGLYLCAAIAQAHGGELQLLDGNPKNTEFHLRFALS
jgi:signal transduction histidine kinase